MENLKGKLLTRNQLSVIRGGFLGSLASCWAGCNCGESGTCEFILYCDGGTNGDCSATDEEGCSSEATGQNKKCEDGNPNGSPVTTIGLG